MCHLIPHPSYVDILLDSHTFVTCHKMDMTYIYCDSWFVGVSLLLTGVLQFIRNGR